MNLHIFHATAKVSDFPYRNLNLLMSTFENGATENDIKKTKDLLRRAKPQQVMLDSGGKSLYNAEKKNRKILSDPSLPVYKKSKKKINLTPEHVMRAALELKPDIIVSLDLPIQNKDSDKDTDTEFKYKLPVNLAYAEEMSKSWRLHCADAKFLVPVQAKTVDQLEIFLEGLMSKGVKYTGLSIPFNNVNPATLVQFMMKFHEMRVPWVHILGTTSMIYLGIAAYFARQKMFKMVTMDSSTWKSCGRNGSYLKPQNLLQCKTDKSTFIPEELRNGCLCPFCKNIDLADSSLKIAKERWVYAHNTWVTEWLARKLYTKAGRLDSLVGYMMHHRSPNQKVEQAIDALNLVGNYLN
jgi:queuine/archaeosine tRNA-ribosyltransferase